MLSGLQSYFASIGRWPVPTIGWYSRRCFWRRHCVWIRSIQHDGTESEPQHVSTSSICKRTQQSQRSSDHWWNCRTQSKRRILSPTDVEHWMSTPLTVQIAFVHVRERDVYCSLIFDDLGEIWTGDHLSLALFSVTTNGLSVSGWSKHPPKVWIPVHLGSFKCRVFRCRLFRPLFGTGYSW